MVFRHIHTAESVSVMGYEWSVAAIFTASDQKQRNVLQNKIAFQLKADDLQI